MEHFILSDLLKRSKMQTLKILERNKVKKEKRRTKLERSSMRMVMVQSLTF